MSCKIFIKDICRGTRTVCVNSEEELKNMTLKEFIRRFCPEEEDLDICRYFFKDRELKSDRTLGFYGIEDCCTIHTVLCLRGGGGLPEDEDKGMSRTESKEILADMQQTEPESKR